VDLKQGSQNTEIYAERKFVLLSATGGGLSPSLRWKVGLGFITRDSLELPLYWGWGWSCQSTICYAKGYLCEIVTFHTYALLLNCFYIVTPFKDFVYLGALMNTYFFYSSFQSFLLVCLWSFWTSCMCHCTLTLVDFFSLFFHLSFNCALHRVNVTISSTCREEIFISSLSHCERLLSIPY